MNEGSPLLFFFFLSLFVKARLMSRRFAGVWFALFGAV